MGNKIQKCTNLEKSDLDSSFWKTTHGIYSVHIQSWGLKFSFIVITCDASGPAHTHMHTELRDSL